MEVAKRWESLNLDMLSIGEIVKEWYTEFTSYEFVNLGCAS